MFLNINLPMEISIFHLNILLLLGLALFGGTIGGKLFQKLKIPQVVGYIAIGIALGQSGFELIGKDMVNTLQPFSYFALGLIGFMIGGELKKDVILKYGKQFINILLFEGITTFLVVSVLVGIIGSLFLGDYRVSWTIAILLGAIASATAPAATTAVLNECKTRGPLTRTILGIVALDDGLALLFFAIASSIAGSLSLGLVNGNTWLGFLYPIYKILGSIALGFGAGYVLKKVMTKYSEDEILLTFSIGTVLLMSGIAFTIKVDMLLAAMALGVVITNFASSKSDDIFKLMRAFVPPIYVLFFVMVGAKLNITYMTPYIIMLGLVYLIGRSAGKVIGARMGARVSGAVESVKKYIPLCLFSQAGVAIGLSILASHQFSGQVGNTIVIIITGTTFILEIIGPAFVKVAVSRAGEVGLNITEEDIIKRSKAKDIMDKTPPLIYEDMNLTSILKLFSENENLYYPVVSKDKNLKGIITVEGIKQTLFDMDVGNLILAHDFMESVKRKAFPETTMSEIQKVVTRHNLEYLPIVTKNNQLEGFIERNRLQRYISTQIIKLQKQIDSLE